MITRFTTYINESRKSIDELEMLTPYRLGQILHIEIGMEESPDLQYIQNILDVGCPINIVDENGQTALHVAAMKGNYENPEDVFEFLIYKGGDINARDDDGWTPLHYAASRGNLWNVEFLTSKGADVNIRDNDGRSAWQYAARKVWLSVTEFLIDHGADVNAKDDEGWAELHWAAQDGYSTIVELLLKSGADIYDETDDGDTAWDLAGDELRNIFPELNPNK